MNKYETGKYRLHLFDKHGTKLHTQLHGSFTQARLIGEETIKTPPAASYAITHVVANSIDTAYPWNVKPARENQYLEVD